MFALCIESSHQKGMGHLFRMLHFVEFLGKKNIPCVALINDDPVPCRILQKKNVMFETVDLKDSKSAWEKKIITKYHVDAWINDRLDTNINHAEHVKETGAKLVTFDDRGNGAKLADINFAALSFDDLRKFEGGKVFCGLEYLILNANIVRYRRTRHCIEKIIVTLGGSDTYGVSVKVVKIFKKLRKKATVLIGPSFMHKKELEAELNTDFTVLEAVPSLPKLLYEYDLAVTGGGVTPFEANSLGLPCIVIASEIFEIERGRFLEKLGSSVFAGYHKEIDDDVFDRELPLEKMSAKGMEAITMQGTENVYREIMAL